MKKTNSRYHSNNNNNSNNNYNSIFSLNYKFDSISPAGKTCGTALDLIKKYNDLAKEAHGNGDYVESEVFRQYAEHYRKIVTEINERKNQRQAMFNNTAAPAQNAAETPIPAVSAEPVRADIDPVSPVAPVVPVAPIVPETPNTPVAPGAPTPSRPQASRPRPQRRRDIQSAAREQSPVEAAPAAVVEPVAEPAPAKREFKVIEISPADSKAELISEAKPAKAPRSPRRKTLSVAML